MTEEDYIKDLDYRIRWLLHTHELFSEDGTYCFPDGDVYEAADWPDK